MEDRGDDETDRAQDQERRAQARRRAVEDLARIPQPAPERARAEDQKDVADDRARDRGLDQIVQPRAERDDRDDQLGRVPERRVQQPADPLTQPLRQTLRRPAHQTASGMIASAEAMKIVTPPASTTYSRTSATGTKTRRSRSQFRRSHEIIAVHTWRASTDGTRWPRTARSDQNLRTPERMRKFSGYSRHTPTGEDT